MMNSSSRQNAVFSIGSDSSSEYSDNSCKSNSNLVGTQAHRPFPLESNLGGSRRETAQNFEGTFAASVTRELTTPDLDDEREYNRDTSSNYTAAYRFKTQQEAEERHRQNAAEARPTLHNIQRDTTLDESRTFMDRILAEHSAAIAASNSDEYRLQDEDNEEPIAQHIAPAGPHMRVISADAFPSRHMRGTLLSATSLASNDTGELTEESAHENTRSSKTTEYSFQPVTPRPRALTLSDIPSELWLDRSSSPASNRSAHQSAALLALDGANGESDRLLPRESSGQWLGQSSRPSSLTARRQGRVDWQKSALLSSPGRQYGQGNCEEGYVAGDYVTVIKDDAQPDKEKRRRDVWKRISCF